MRRQFAFTTEEVFKVIEGERDYQESRWNPETTTSHGNHSWEEWITYIEDYLSEAKHKLSREAKQETDVAVGHIMRKVAAMTVAAMEQNGCPRRPGYER